MPATEEFVGIVERNAWEREVFGYYWPRTEASESALRGIAERYASEGETSISFELASRAKLEDLADRDRNGYMARVCVYEPPEDWAAFVERIAPPDQPIASSDVHPFYKGRALDDLRVRDWRTSNA